MSAIEVRTELRRMLEQLARGSDFGDHDDVFAKRIVSSLNLVELIVQLEDRFGIAISERDVFEGRLRTLEGMAALVVTRAEARP